MRALSLWQPWASLLIWGFKQYETRSWQTAYRGPLAIHAAKRWQKEQIGLASQFVREYPELRADGILRTTYDNVPPLGCVLGIVELEIIYRTEDIRDSLSPMERDFGDFSRGRYAWEVRVLERFETPVPYRGAQGIWEWKPDSPTNIRRSEELKRCQITDQIYVGAGDDNDLSSEGRQRLQVHAGRRIEGVDWTGHTYIDDLGHKGQVWTVIGPSLEPSVVATWVIQSERNVRSTIAEAELERLFKKPNVGAAVQYDLWGRPFITERFTDKLVQETMFTGGELFASRRTKVDVKKASPDRLKLEMAGNTESEAERQARLGREHTTAMFDDGILRAGDAHLLKSKWYPVNLRRGIVYNDPYNRQGDIRTSKIYGADYGGQIIGVQGHAVPGTFLVVEGVYP